MCKVRLYLLLSLLALLCLACVSLGEVAVGAAGDTAELGEILTPVPVTPLPTVAPPLLPDYEERTVGNTAGDYSFSVPTDKVYTVAYKNSVGLKRLLVLMPGGNYPFKGLESALVRVREYAFGQDPAGTEIMELRRQEDIGALGSCTVYYPDAGRKACMEVE